MLSVNGVAGDEECRKGDVLPLKVKVERWIKLQELCDELKAAKMARVEELTSKQADGPTIDYWSERIFLLPRGWTLLAASAKVPLFSSLNHIQSLKYLVREKHSELVYFGPDPKISIIQTQYHEPQAK